MLFDLITTKELGEIDFHRQKYTSGDVKRFCSTQKFLAFWEQAKSQHLAKLFGDKLIVKEPVTCTESISQIEDKIEEMRYNDSRICNFINDMQDNLMERNSGTCYWWFMDNKSLAANKVTDLPHDDCEIILADGKVYKITNGMKPMRIISKIAKSYKVGTAPGPDGISDLEYFRLQHSLCLNQKEIKGDLHLSIHPLDFITMSDNDQNWSSCMSWEDYGDYRQGTVEMMNSPYVVVGYLTPTGGNWYNKKWRCLFLVDPDNRFIVSVKAYPYFHEDLIHLCLKRLAEMAGWDNPEVKVFDDESNVLSGGYPSGRTVFLEFLTEDHAMYNDFGLTTHYLMINPNIEKNIDEIIDYCGKTECVWCGETMRVPENGSSLLSCSECYPTTQCYECGCYREDSELYTTEDGYQLCEYCYENSCYTDGITDKVYWSEDNIKSIVLYDSSDSMQRIGHCIYLSTDTINDKDNYKDYFKKIHLHGYWGDGGWKPNYVLFKDCTKKGLELFGASEGVSYPDLDICVDFS